MNRRLVKILILLLAAMLWLLPASAGAMSGDEFLSLCADAEYPGRAGAVKKAIAGGVNVNYAGPSGLTPLMVLAGSGEAADWQTVLSVEMLIKAGAQVNARSQDGGTALAYAALHKAGAHLISTLIKNGADVNLGVTAQGGLTPLMIAAGSDPDPVVSALLLAAGADISAAVEKDGQRLGLVELAAKNPNPKVGRFIEEAAKGGVREAGLPLFYDAPQDQELRRRIKNLDQRIRALAGDRDWTAWLSYIRWQTELGAAVELRQTLFGNGPEAWLNEYVHFLESLEMKKGQGQADDKAPGRLIVQSRWNPAAPVEAAAVAGRRIVVVGRPERRALVAYEEATGRELWSHTPGALSDFFILKRPGGKGDLIFAASHWGGNFGDAAVLEAESGAVIWQLPPLDSPRWAISGNGGHLAVATDYSLNILDLATGAQSSHDWHELLETTPWEEALAEARSGQNKILSRHGLSLDGEGQFAGGSRRLFDKAASLDAAMLARTKEALSGHDYKDLAVLAADTRGPGRNNFILGSPCVSNCSAAALATPLFLVNTAANQVDVLLPEGDQSKMLTRAHLGEMGGGAIPLAFSPGGKLLAVGTAGGDVYFFAARESGRYLGLLNGPTPVPGGAVKDFKLAGLLDDEAARPFIALKSTADASTLMLPVDLAAGTVGRAFMPLSGRGAGLAAFAASADGRLAAALDNGGLMLINPAGGTVDSLERPAPGRLTALALADGAFRLAAAGADGGLYIYDGRRLVQRLALQMKDISHLALSGDGRLLWAAGNNQAGRPSLAFIDLQGAAPVYRTTDGPVVSLRFEAKANYAVAVENVPSPPQPGELEAGPMNAARWGQGRVDIIKFDHLRSKDKDGRAAVYDAEKSFVGLAPDVASIIYQDLRPSRAFVDIGREEIRSRNSSGLESFNYQAAVGPAAFSPDGRLALLMEKGHGGGTEPWPFYSGGAFYVYDLVSGREMVAMTDRAPHPYGVLGGAFLPGPGRAVTAGRDGVLRLWDLSGTRAVNLLSWFFFDDGAWAVVDKDGRFDAPAPDRLDSLHWAGAETTVPLAAFLRDYYQPRLSAWVLAGPPLAALGHPLERSLFRPEVKFVGLAPEKDKPGRMSVSLEVGALNNGRAELPREVRLYCNGRLAGLARPEAGAKTTGGVYRHTFSQVALPAGRTEAVFLAEAVNSGGVRSDRARAAVKYKMSGSSRGRLYLTAIDPDGFSNPAWNYQGAGETAPALARALPPKFSGESEVSVLTGGGGPGAVKDNIQRALRDLGQAAGADDALVVAINSRGFTAGGQFYFLPADVPGTDRAITPELLGRAVSSVELADWLSEIKSRDSALIIVAGPPDEAGAAFEPGPMGDRTLALLAYDQGLLFLAAGEAGPAPGAILKALDDDALPRRGNAPPQFSGGLNVSAGNELDSPLTANLKQWLAKASSLLPGAPALFDFNEKTAAE